MSVLLQISDTHFGTEQPHVVDALLRLKQEIEPEVIVWSGDITQRARRAQFEAAGSFLEQLKPARVLSIPGNHDIPLFNLPARLFFPYAGYMRIFGSDLEPQHESDDLRVLCINTTRRYRHVDGEISPAQIERAARWLMQGAKECVRIVVTHQPVHVIKEKDEKNIVHGHEAAVRRWVQAGADVVMGGHIHLPYVRPLDERFAGLPRRAWSVQAGTALSRRVRHGAPNSVNLLRRISGNPPVCVVERWDYEASLACFSLVETHRLAVDRTRIDPLN